MQNEDGETKTAMQTAMAMQKWHDGDANEFPNDTRSETLRLRGAVWTSFGDRPKEY